MAIRAKYKGDGGEYLEGIPARDISDDEYQAMTKEQREMVRASNIYDSKTDAQMSGGASSDKGGGD